MHLRSRKLKLRVVTAIAAACLGAVSYAAAATLGVTSSALQTGNVAVPQCDTDGFTYTRALDGSHNVSSVTVSGINSACNGGTLWLTLADSGNVSIGSGSAAVGTTGNVTVSISGAPSGASVASYRVAITN